MLPFRYYGGNVLIAPKSENQYFKRYRSQYPEEDFSLVDYDEVLRFFSYQYDEDKAVACLALLGLSETKAKELLPYLCRMLKDHYKHEELQVLLHLKEALVREGIFQIHGDSAAFFCNKSIIIRGYYSGLPISEALQDLPNISLNWDLGRPELKDEEIARVECSNVEEAVYKARDSVDAMLEEGVLPSDIYFHSDLPNVTLPGIQTLTEPYAPTGGKVIYLETKKEDAVEKDLFSPMALAELHLVPSATKAKRKEEDEKRFLRHPSLVTRLYVFLPD